MKVSIITVCKNSEEYIERSIESVICQSYKNIEYIIIDGDSDDRTKEIISQYAEFITKFISEPDRGLYEAMNKGIKQATGDYLYFLNSDDYLSDREVIQDVVNYISKHPSPDLVYGNLEQVTISGEVFLYQPPAPENVAEEMIVNCCLPQPASFFKSSLFGKLGYFSESYKIASDYEWFTRIIQAKNINLLYYPRIISCYYCGGLSGKNLKLAYTEMFEIQNKVPIYQTNLWQQKKIEKLQISLAEQHDLVRRLENLSNERYKYAEVNRKFAQECENLIHAQEARIAGMEEKIAAMESTKFWKLRTLWVGIKKIVNISA